MKLHPVKSSNITHIGHDGDKTMHVKYSSGDTYEFHPVTEDQHAKLIKSDSKGSHLHKMGIKGKKLEAKKH